MGFTVLVPCAHALLDEVHTKPRAVIIASTRVGEAEAHTANSKMRKCLCAAKEAYIRPCRCCASFVCDFTFSTMANDDYGVDIWTQWAFAGLAIGLTMTLHLAITTWKCQQNGLSSTSSFTSWRMRFDDGDCWMHTALPIYMIHQFEEHGVDMLGRRYSFQKALCQAVVSIIQATGWHKRLMR